VASAAASKAAAAVAAAAAAAATFGLSSVALMHGLASHARHVGASCGSTSEAASPSNAAVGYAASSYGLENKLDTSMNAH